MTDQLLFLKPALQEKIWGGRKLKDYFGLDIPSDHTGEAWLISAHPNGLSYVTTPGLYQGMSLAEVYQVAPELFGNPEADTFPLLTKILDASDDLSVQVHPDDAYGLEYEGELGKTECWYIIDAEPRATIVYGHTANSRAEFEQAIQAVQWEQLLRKVEVKAGDFFYVPAGTVHAIGAGITILETQQNSDTTYRLYDYDRKDDQGNFRDLHLSQSADVVNYPHVDPQLEIKMEEYDGGTLTHLLDADYFKVDKLQVNSTVTLPLDGTYWLATVIAGEGTVVCNGEVYSLTPASSFIVPAAVNELVFKGEMTLILSQPNNV